MRTFYSIVLPLIRPMLVSIFVLVFISALRDISTIIFLASAKSQTLSLLMMQFATVVEPGSERRDRRHHNRHCRDRRPGDPPLRPSGRRAALSRSY